MGAETLSMDHEPTRPVGTYIAVAYTSELLIYYVCKDEIIHEVPNKVLIHLLRAVSVGREEETLFYTEQRGWHELN